MDVQRLGEELRKEIGELEFEKVRIEERLAEKQRTLARLVPGVVIQRYHDSYLPEQLVGSASLTRFSDIRY